MGLYEQVDYDFSGPLQPQDLFGREFVIVGTMGKILKRRRTGNTYLPNECDPATVAAEFLLAKASYKAMTGREQKKGSDVLCYQIVLVFYSNMGGVLNGENFDC